MSSGLMSCVRENSPAMDDAEQTSGPLSLPVAHSTSFSQISNDNNFNDTSCTRTTATLPAEVDVNNTVVDQKRRRFQPFRNLRRIFRRRTISSTPQEKNSPTENCQKPEQSISATVRVFRATNCQSKLNFEKKKTKDVSGTQSKVVVNPVVKLTSSPSSPLTQQQLQEAYSSLSLPKCNKRDASCSSSSLLSKSLSKFLDKTPTIQQFEQDACDNCELWPHLPNEEEVMYAAASAIKACSMEQTSPARYMIYQNTNQFNQASRKSLGIAVLPTIAKRDSYSHSHQQDTTDYMHKDNETNAKACAVPISNTISNESNTDELDMCDNQRSLSEGRLVDSDCCEDPLSHSHDSVFSESATASSLCSVLKAELADVLRKRRNRPDASDEDLGLPRSPISPRRFNESQHHQLHTSASQGNSFHHNEQSALSFHSPGSSEIKEFLVKSTSNNSLNQSSAEKTKPEDNNKANIQASSRHAHRSSMITIASQNTKRHSLGSNTFQDIGEEVDGPRLTHAGARHKMALRPKKKAPSRLQRRTIDNSIPEANETVVRVPSVTAFFDGAKVKTRSLPPGIDAKALSAHASMPSKENMPDNDNFTSYTLSSTTGCANLAQYSRKRTKEELGAPHMETTQFPLFNFRTLTTKASDLDLLPTNYNENTVSENSESIDIPESKTVGNNFLRRITMRNSKRSLNKEEDECDRNEPKKQQISTTSNENSAKEHRPVPDVNKKIIEMSYEQFIKDTRQDIKEMKNETKTGLSALLNNFINSSSETKLSSTTRNSIAISPSNITIKPKSGPEARQRYAPISINIVDTNEKQPSKTVKGNIDQETFQSTAIVRQITATQMSPKTVNEQHFERKPKIVGLSAFQQKISRSNDSVKRQSLNCMEFDDNKLDDEKSRKSVEKSRSFRLYGEDKNLSGKNSNMPSLPDLSTKERTISNHYFNATSPNQDKSVSLGFEINDNNLMRSQQGAKNTQNVNKSTVDLTTRVLVPPSTGGNRDITEIEQNIDMIMKAPFVTVLESKSQTLSSKSSEDLTQKTKSRPNRLSLKLEEATNDLSEFNLSPKTTFMVRPKYITRSSIMKEAADIQRSTESVHKTLKSPTEVKSQENTVPEFMKIQLNRIDTAKKSTDNVVLAKNIKSNANVSKECSPTPSTSSNGTTTTTVRSHSRDRSLSPISPKCVNFDTNKTNSSSVLLHNSNESIEIQEQNTPTENKVIGLIEAINGDARVLVSDFLARNKLKPYQNVSSNNSPTSPGSGLLKNLSPQFPTTQNTADKKQPSLQERRRFFLAEDKTSVDKKTEELRMERKKSIGEEVLQRKESTYAENRSSSMETVKSLKNNIPQKYCELSNKNLNTFNGINKTAMEPLQVTKFMQCLNGSNVKLIPETSVTSMKSNDAKFPTFPDSHRCPADAAKQSLKAVNMASVPLTQTSEPASVILRKKVQPESNIEITTVQTPRKKTERGDEPELLKVFARRSLKVKDDDVIALSEKLNASTVTARKSICVAQLSANQQQQQQQKLQQNMDSDKENQSASQEKLDKLSKSEAALEKISNNNNYNSINKQSLMNGTQNTNNNNSNNNNNNSASESNLSKERAPIAKLRTSQSLERKLTTNGQSKNINYSAHNSNNTNNNKNNISSPLSPGKSAAISFINTNNNNNNNNNFQNSKTLNKHNGSDVKINNIKSLDAINGNTQSQTTKKHSQIFTAGKTSALEIASKLPAIGARSATVSEFKNINQRRAEWEQRAKGILP